MTNNEQTVTVVH